MCGACQPLHLGKKHAQNILRRNLLVCLAELFWHPHNQALGFLTHLQEVAQQELQPICLEEDTLELNVNRNLLLSVKLVEKR